MLDKAGLSIRDGEKISGGGLATLIASAPVGQGILMVSRSSMQTRWYVRSQMHTRQALWLLRYCCAHGCVQKPIIVHVTTQPANCHADVGLSDAYHRWSWLPAQSCSGHQHSGQMQFLSGWQSLDQRQSLCKHSICSSVLCYRIWSMQCVGACIQADIGCSAGA